MKDVETHAEFIEKQEHNKYLVVYVTANWCGPCASFYPIIKRASKVFGHLATFIKIDVDQIPEVAETFGIMSVPSLVLLHQGKQVEHIMGAQPYQHINQWLTERLLAKV